MHILPTSHTTQIWSVHRIENERLDLYAHVKRGFRGHSMSVNGAAGRWSLLKIPFPEKDVRYSKRLSYPTFIAVAPTRVNV